MKAICYICGKEFNRKPALIKRAKHPTCSNECRRKVYEKQRPKLICSYCGEEFEAKVQKTTDEQMFIVKKQLVFTNVSLDTYISQYYGKYVNEKNLYKALIIENSVKYYCEIMYQRIRF